MTPFFTVLRQRLAPFAALAWLALVAAASPADRLT